MHLPALDYKYIIIIIIIIIIILVIATMMMMMMILAAGGAIYIVVDPWRVAAVSAEISHAAASLKSYFSTKCILNWVGLQGVCSLENSTEAIGRISPMFSFLSSTHLPNLSHLLMSKIEFTKLQRRAFGKGTINHEY